MTLQRKVPEVNEFRRTPSFGDPRRNDPNATIDLADCAISLHRFILLRLVFSIAVFFVLSHHHPAFDLTLNLSVPLLHLFPCLTILCRRRTGSQIEKEWITTATPQRTVSRAGRSYIVLPERIQRDQGFKRYCHASSFYNQLQSMYYESWCTKPNLGSRHFPLDPCARVI